MRKNSVVLHQGSTRLFLLIACLIACAGVVLSMFRPSEMGGESWVYWYFARVFSETGKFIIFDRSPIYVLYLSVFRTLSYPHSVLVEYFLTSLIPIAAIFLFFRSYVGPVIALIAGCLWVPFFQTSEPPVQKIAFGLALLAVSLRSGSPTRSRISLSYAALIFAYLFRQTHILLLGVFVAYDLLMSLIQGTWKTRRFWRLNIKSDWPIVAALAFMVYVAFNQSPSPWNNVWLATTDWFPNNGKNMADGGSVQCFNWAYILKKYGTFVGHDFYFTNREAFGGATTMSGLFKANPKLIIEILVDNIRALVHVMMVDVKLPEFGFHIVDTLSIYGFLACVIGGALFAARDNFVRLFVLGNLAMIGVTILDLPKIRYMVPMIPLFIMASSWYGAKISKFLQDRIRSDKRILNRLIAYIPTLLLVLFVSQVNFAAWGDVQLSRGRLLENEEFSMKGTFSAVSETIKDCRGVMALESSYVGAFVDTPLSRVFDVFEIPPFGNLAHSDYKGLNPERINCVMVSKSLVTGVGAATNFQIRYDNYIKPYVAQLIGLGATVHEIPRYGQIIVLNK